MIGNSSHAKITTKLYHTFFWLYAPDTKTTSRFKRSSVQTTAERGHKPINYLQRRFSKSLKYPEKQLNCEIMACLFPSLLVVFECSASTWTYYKWSCCNTWKNLCVFYFSIWCSMILEGNTCLPKMCTFQK